MKNATHTNAPWTWKENEALIGPDNALVFGIMRTPAERDANRRLVSTAPDLLEACKTILLNLDPEGDHPRHQHVLYSDCLGPENDDQTIVEYLRKLISKAEGNA